MEQHDTQVRSFLTGAENHKAGQHQAECSACGPVGPMCDLRADAQAIADRHAEIQGFERA